MPCYSEKEYIWSCIIIYFKIDLDIYTQQYITRSDHRYPRPTFKTGRILSTDFSAKFKTAVNQTA